jgi:succinyl-CoA synthetase alpha subunit
MQLLEHVAKAIAAGAGIPVPRGEVATTPAEAVSIAAVLGGRVAVKAQVPAGGRGRAGGILLVDASEAGAAAARLLGAKLRGFTVDSVLIEEAIEAAEELYLAVAVRPAERAVVLLLSVAGGVDVEQAREDQLGLVPIPITDGLRPWHVWRAAARAEIDPSQVPALIDLARRAHDLFWRERAELVEINPLFVASTGGLMAGDVRIVPDADTADDATEAVPPELRFDFVVLDPKGTVGLVTTGAGGSMHLIDRLAAAGLRPIDFCDIRTGRPRGLAERLRSAFERVAVVPSLRCIAINFFAGVTILDEVTPILIDVIRAASPRAPIVARLEGRGAEQARAQLAEIGVRCATSLDELVRMVGEVAALATPAGPAKADSASVRGRVEATRASAWSPSEPASEPAQAAPGLPLARGTSGGRGSASLSTPPLWTVLDAAQRGVVVQGMTGQIGRRHTSRMRAYGTPILAGVTPGRGGTVVDGVPVFNTVTEAVEATGVRASIAFLPAEVAADGIVEAAESGVGLIVCPTEGIRLHDALRALDAAHRHGARVVGPNTGGLLVPDKLSLGFLPSDFARPGPCAVLSRSGTLSYETVLALANVGLGLSAWIGVGGDRVKGSTFADLLPDLLADDRTGAVVLLGEIGGSDEEDAAALLAGARKPVVALLVGRTAPPGISMGHAGAIVDGARGSYESKRDALLAAGVTLAASPAELAAILSACLAAR